MEAYKLSGRMEDVRWDDPQLNFRIERHGGTVLGSSRAELQHWTLDLNAQTRKCTVGEFRKLRQTQGPLDVKKIAEEIASVIQIRENDNRVKWYPEGHVRVLIGVVLPEGSAVKQTLAGRRKRFWKNLDSCLEPDWIRKGQTYYPQVDGHQP